MDEVAAQPAWLQEDANGDTPAALSEGLPAVQNLTLDEHAASNGAVDFIGLGLGGDADGNTAAQPPPAPYANGDSSHEQPPPAAMAGAGPAASAPPPDAAAAPRDPLEDLLALSPTPVPAQPEAPKPGILPLKMSGI